jgi:hypothetical protein
MEVKTRPFIRPERRKTEAAEMCCLRHGVAQTANGCTAEELEFVSQYDEEF